MALTYEQLLAIANAARDDAAAELGGDWTPPTPLVNWDDAYGVTEEQTRWLTQPLIPTSGSVAVFAKGGTGKSLLALWLAAGLATGNTLTGPAEPVDVLYLDYEMTIRDVVERLEDMGHDDPTTLKRLHYASLPTLPPLDSEEGGRAVVAMARHFAVTLVVIDTFSRAVNGEENGADTVRNWYRWTGQLLKDARIGFMRIDHAGKDVKRGQRGTSAKNDDVDVVWEMTSKGQEFVLRAVKRRVPSVPDAVSFTQTRDNGILAYRWIDAPTGYLAGTKEVAEQLDRLGAPLDISRRRALALLREAGLGRDNNVVADALRHRREQAGKVVLNTTTGGDQGIVEYQGSDTNTKPLEYHHEYQGIPLGDHNGGWLGMTESYHPPVAGDRPVDKPDPGVIG